MTNTHTQTHAYTFTCFGSTEAELLNVRVMKHLRMMKWQMKHERLIENQLLAVTVSVSFGCVEDRSAPSCSWTAVKLLTPFTLGLSL